ncbi:MAG: radical SAM protein [Bacteroidetes bacterium]|nr:MAG: radical SAM protein [Bacteroidota bacterium]
MVGTGLTEIRTLSEEAFSIRKKNFTNDVHYYAPGLKSYEITGFNQKNPNAFLPISITGGGCALACDHCNKRILDPMLPLQKKEGLFNMCKRLAENGTTGVLISGGSRKSGEVPLDKHIDDIARIKSELGLNVMVHTGLILEDSQAKMLKDADVDGVALDIIGSNETIRDVYHLDKTIDDFDRSLELLSSYDLSLRPHIILGLHYGKMLGEYAALDMIAKYNVDALIIVILTPLTDTAMWGVEPPATDEVIEFFGKARVQMPNTHILLGCARPLGEYKRIVDMGAIVNGINGIAYPAEGVIEHSISMGLKPLYFEDSCSCGIKTVTTN